MDSYPGDLLAGVFPLVFAVDAIASPAAASASSTTADSGEKNSATEEKEVISPSLSTRSLFDRFLDALAASLVDDEATDDISTANHSRTGSETVASLFSRGDDNESSDEEDFSFLDNASHHRRGGRRSSPMGSFLHMNRRGGHHNSLKSPPAYANYHSGEGFFQRARILSISTRHGFPPSKDPEGTQNRALLLSQARSTMALGATGANALRLKKIMEQQPVDGILPAGWLEKHVHALPSALLVVTSLSNEEEPDKDNRLLETIEHLQESLAPKRECHIHVVCLIEDLSAVSQSRIDGWFDQLRARSSIQSSDISLLSMDDLLPSSLTSSSSPALRGLHKTVRDASLAYYLRQARRAKRKHNVLGHERQPNLLPLAIRYCFKIGVFYEFQLKHAKSLRYFAEAYRHAETYYRHLLGIAVQEPGRDVLVNPQGDDMIEMSLPETEASSTMDSEHANENDDDEDENADSGIEVALADKEQDEDDDDEDDDTDDTESEEEAPSSANELKKIDPEVETPDDMSHQCRAVADWLNFKLMQAGFLSSAYTESPEGILAASAQWRRHSQCLLRKDKANPNWNHWLFVSHQRLVMSQLVERHQPRSSEGLTDEVLLRCSPWRNYQAVAEAILRLGAELGKQQASKSANNRSEAPGSDMPHGSSLRKRYVGGLDSEGLTPSLHEESKKNHTAIALELTLRAIALFESEIESQEKKEGNDETRAAEMFVRSGSRLYYLAGGMLVGVQRYKEAIPHLEKATRYSAGWSGLEAVARSMLAECYERHPPEHTDSPIKKPSSFVLETFFNGGMSSQNFSVALEKYAASQGASPLKWNLTSMDESDSSLPFSFSVTFPGSTHGTAGDAVSATVTVKSNLKHPIVLRGMTLLSMTEQILVPQQDLLGANSAGEVSNDGIILQPSAEIFLSTKINLPKDVEKIALEESSSPEKPATPGKASSVKSARPRTAGISSAAGARLASEKLYGSGPSAQWSLSCLGGRALRCDGMRLAFSPLSADQASSTVIEMTIEKKKREIPANMKRTPFEHDNYIAVAWARPAYLPLSSGPRCLRVLGPLPKMVVTNLTSPFVDGKALEGTVNRILLKLKAGDAELCRDVKYSVQCSSTVLLMDGTTRNLTEEEGPSSPGGSEDDALIEWRTPVIVHKSSGTAKQSSKYGFDLPPGWELVGTGQKTLDDDDAAVAVSGLASREETYIALDLYRPTRIQKASVDQLARTDKDGGICQTDFVVSITYRQSRKMPADAGHDESDASDEVSLEHSGSVVWTSPISADFGLSAAKKAHSAGSRHPSNLCPSESGQILGNASSSEDDGEPEIALIDGERVNAKCLLRAKDSLGVEIVELRFENWEDPSSYEETACAFRHVSDQTENDGVLYKSTGAGASGQLKQGSKFGITYTVEANMLSEYKKGSVTAALGALCVYWRPLPIPLPDDLCEHPELKAHGPLCLQEPSTMSFRGPPCYIESAPFETILESSPTSPPRVATPFEMSYRISNKTGMHQKLSVRMTTNETDSSDTEGVLVSGLVNGEIRLAPYESQTLSYTALAMRAGKTMLPAISIASERYKTWVVNGDSLANRQLYVLP